MEHGPLNINTLGLLSDLMVAAEHGDKVRWTEDDGETIREGVVRHFVRDEDLGFLRAEDDVRDAYVRITGPLTEYILPVARIVELMDEGAFSRSRS